MREQRGGLRAHVGEYQSAVGLDGVAGDLDLLLEASVRVDGLLEGLLDALAGLVHHPAVVHAAQAVLLGDAVGEVDAAMGAEAFDEAQRAGLVFVEDEVLTEDADSLRGAVIEFGGSGDGVPVAAVQLAHRRTGHDTREVCVLLCGEHGLEPPRFVKRRIAGVACPSSAPHHRAARFPPARE